MPEYEDRHLDFVLKHYRKGVFGTKAAVRRFREETGQAARRPKRNWRLCAVLAAAVVIMAVFFRYLEQNRWTVLTSGDAMAVFTLPDSSSVALAPHSSVRYRAYRFAEGGRKVDMYGKVFFIVSHDSGNPFEVFSEDAYVRVLGTKFMVDETRPAAGTAVYVDDGKVYFAGSDKSGGLTMTKGMSATFHRGDSVPQPDEYGQINSVAWARGSFIFDHTPLREALGVIAGHYGVSLASTDLDKTITGEFWTEDLDTVIAVIESALDVRITVKK